MTDATSMPSSAADCAGTKAALPPESAGDGAPIKPGPDDGIPLPDAATCESLRPWNHDTLKLAGLSLPGAMASALRDICSQRIAAAKREEAALTALALLDGVPPTPEIRELEATLKRLCSGHDEPHPQPSAGPIEEARTAQAGPPCSNQQAAVAAQAVGVSPTTKVIPGAGIVTDAGTRPQAIANAEDGATKVIPIAEIVTDAGTQVRATVNTEVVGDYGAAMAAGAVFPDIVVFLEGSRYYLADGSHRLRASELIGRTEIAAKVYAGGAKDALWYALGANRANGMRLGANDKAFAVTKALHEFPEKSQTQIAEHVGCAQSYVHKVKQGIASTALPNPVPQDITSDNLAKPARVTGVDGKSYPATRPRKAKALKAVESPDASAGSPGLAAGNAAEALLPSTEAPASTAIQIEPTAEEVTKVVVDTLTAAATGSTPLDCLAQIASTLRRGHPAFYQRVRHLLPATTLC